MFAGKKVLVLSPHPDDAELGAGASIAKMAEQGARIHWVTFSWCDQSLPKGADIQSELAHAVAALGVRKKDIVNFVHPVRRFDRERQEILEEMIRLRKDIEPDIVLAPCSFDIHQDHSTIHREAVRAYKHGSLIGFEEPWNNLSERLGFFVSLEEKHLQKKIDAVAHYRSQKEKGRTYANAEYLRSLAIVRGQQINEKYAEAFEIIRWVWR